MSRREQTVSLPELMRWALAERAEQELSAMPSPRALEQLFPDMSALRQKVFSALRERERTRRRQQRRPLRMLARVLVAAAVLISILSGLLLANAAVRSAVIDTIIDWTDRNVGIRFEVTEPYLDRLPEGYGPHYIPEGLVFDEENSWQSDSDFLYTYQSEDGTMILDLQIGIAQNGSHYQMDNEHTEFEMISFQGTDAYLGHGFALNGAEMYVMLWVKDGIEHHIYTNFSLSEIFKIAENIY